MDNIPIFNQNGLKAKVGSSKAGTYSPSNSYTVDDIINGGAAWQNIDLITFLQSGKPTVELVETLGSVLYVGTYKINEIIALLKSGVDGQFLGSNLGDAEWQDLPVASEEMQGIIEIADQAEYFNKDNTKAITSENISNDIRKASFSISNKTYNGTQQTDFGDSATWLPTTAPQLIPTGDETLDGGSFVAGLNLLGTMLDTNETTYNDLGDYSGFQFKDTVNAQLNGTGRWFDNTNKKWLAPSPLYTFNESANKKLFFTIRIPELMITTQNSFNGNAMYLYVRLLRYNFNAQNRKIISLIPITLSGIGATANIPYTLLYSTNIKGETDPYVSAGNGFYMDIIKSDKSTAGGGNPAYLRHARIDIEKH